MIIHPNVLQKANPGEIRNMSSSMTPLQLCLDDRTFSAGLSKRETECDIRT